MPKKTVTQLQREIDQALTKRSSWHDEPSSPKKLFRYTKNELEAMPTLSSGHTANLKVEGEVGGIPTRWWLSRMTVEDGESHAVQVEQLIRGRWQEAHAYGRPDTAASRERQHSTMRASRSAWSSVRSPKTRAHATMKPAPREASIWAEVGLEDASDREKAAFWREQLLNEVDDLDDVGVSSSLRPVLADVSEVVDPKVLRAFARDQLDSVASSDYRDAVREIREQILNASIGQIVQYANAHYRSLP